MKGAAFASFFLALPTALLFLMYPSSHVPPWAHTVAPFALFGLACAAFLALFVLAFGIFGRGHNPAARVLAVLLSLPALAEAGLALFMLANIPPT